MGRARSLRRNRCAALRSFAAPAPCDSAHRRASNWPARVGAMKPRRQIVLVAARYAPTLLRAVALAPLRAARPRLRAPRYGPAARASSARALLAP